MRTVDLSQTTSSLDRGLETDQKPAVPRALRITVIALGVLIVLAMVGVIFGMVYRARQIGNTVKLAPSQLGRTDTGRVSGLALSPQSQSARFIDNTKVLLPEHSTVRGVALDGHRLAVHFDGNAGGGIVIIDLITGLEVSRVAIGVMERP